jgi:hypothetical protein
VKHINPRGVESSLLAAADSRDVLGAASEIACRRSGERRDRGVASAPGTINGAAAAGRHRTTGSDRALIAVGAR